MRESEYIRETTYDHRKEYGQFFTPPRIARLMAQWVMKNHPKTIIDPAFGLGIFYDEIIRLHSGDKVYFTGCEIDHHIITYHHYENSQYLKIVNTNYLETEFGCFDGIICNPPYMRF